MKQPEFVCWNGVVTVFISCHRLEIIFMETQFFSKGLRMKFQLGEWRGLNCSLSITLFSSSTQNSILLSCDSLFNGCNLFLLRFTCALIYYGLSINSVELIGNKYLNFILTCAIEIPAIIMTGCILNKIKRRRFLSMTYFVSGIGAIIGELIPPGDNEVWFHILI